MFPNYFNSQMTTGDQLQSNSGQRTDPRYRQDGARPSQLQNPYSAINMGSNVAGQQFDPRFMGAINSGLPPNAALPYNMVSNVYADSMKNMQITIRPRNVSLSDAYAYDGYPGGWVP